MRFDGVRYSCTEIFSVALRAENVFGAIGRRGFMSGAALVQADVVQQSRRLHDFSIGAFGMMGAPLTVGAVSKAWLMEGATAAGMDWGLLAAAGVLTIIPGALVIWFVRNYIARGFALGRV